MNDFNQFYFGLGLMLLMFMWYAIRVQRANKDFKWEDAFRDSDGKPTVLRIIVFPTWLASTVVLFHVVGVDDSEDLQFFVWYIGFWSGSTVIGKLAEVWGQRKG